MKFTAVIFASFYCFLLVGQTAFEQSQKAFQQYLSTDSIRAKKELAFQRKHARSATQKIRFTLNQAAFYGQVADLERMESTLDRIKLSELKKEVTLEGEFVRLRSLVDYRKNNYDASTKRIYAFFQRRKSVPAETRIDLILNICANEIAKGEYGAGLR